MKPNLFYIEVMVHENDLDPYRFFFLDERERDRFGDALSGYVGADGEPLIGGEQEYIYKNAEEAIESVKEFMGWSELPDDSDEEDGS